MAFKAAGAPCDLFRENVLLNAASFSTTVATDDFRQAAHGFISANRNLSRDATAYGTEPLEDGWQTRLRQGWVPANKGGSGSDGALA